MPVLLELNAEATKQTAASPDGLGFRVECCLLKGCKHIYIYIHMYIYIGIHICIYVYIYLHM